MIHRDTEQKVEETIFAFKKWIILDEEKHYRIWVVNIYSESLLSSDADPKSAFTIRV